MPSGAAQGGPPNPPCQKTKKLSILCHLSVCPFRYWRKSGYFIVGPQRQFMNGGSESLKNPFCSSIVSAIGVYQVYRWIKFLWRDLRVMGSHFLRGLIDHLVFGYMLPAVNPESAKSTYSVIDQNRSFIVIFQAIPQKVLFHYTFYFRPIWA